MSPRIFFIGDSFIHGTGDPTCLGWVGRVCARAMAHNHAFTGYNLGVRGDTTQLIHQRWQPEVQSRSANPASVGFVFSFGANDVNLNDETSQPRVPLADSVAYAQAILGDAQKIDPVLMVESPPIANDLAANQRLAELNQHILDLCQVLAIPHIRTCAALLNTPSWMEEAIANDGAHPREQGYTALAEIILSSQQWSQWLEQFSRIDT
ncbi:GDSL-type esterase/lipase family protein [Leptolyngbya iicbica]|uniref:Lipase n=2 Tax=Cyanophyceae TaxID=3028117 RepID=A0A4Q7E4Q9_9CYAN|nr:GDSL-type esterase/lipase family protein [Leptolyngbya sp. LK]RZM77840.1 lipase [Leptolyngbya sp. LK]